MQISQLSNEQYGLLFDVRRSIRYHDRRRSFFEFMHRITAVLTILMAGSILFEIGKTGATASWLIGLSIIAALLAALDMVVGYASKADLHRSLKVRFSKLEMAIIISSDNSAEWDSFHNERLLIEQDEPPIYRALDTLCHNEVVLALGLGQGELYKVNAFHKATRHIFHWSDCSYS